MTPDDSDLEARLNSWNLGVSPWACLELLSYMRLSTCCSSSSVTVNLTPTSRSKSIVQCCWVSRIAYTLLNKGCKTPFTHVLLKPLPLGSSLLLYDVRVGWGVGDWLCKLSIWRCMHLSYLLCLKCTRPGFDKHSALMSFIPLFIPYLLTSMTLSLIFFIFVCLLPPSFLPHFSHISLWVFLIFSFSNSFYHPIFCSLWHFLLLSLHLSFLDSCPLLFSTRVIWGIYQQTWSRALLRSALLCVETLIRGIAWQRSPKPSSFKSTDVPSHTSTETHTNPFKFTEVL